MNAISLIQDHITVEMFLMKARADHQGRLPVNQSIPTCFPQICIGIVFFRNVQNFTVQLC